MSGSEERTYSGPYMILSLKWSDSADRLIWWGPDNAGYTADIDAAGRYTAEQVAGNPSYYDNENTTRAVRVYEVMEGLIGPIRRIVDTTFRYPTRTYNCHVCQIELTTRVDPRFTLVACRTCKTNDICAFCYDGNRCSEEVESGGSSAEDP